MKTDSPGEFIHMITVELSTLKDGKVLMLISVDYYSRYCFSNIVRIPLSFEDLAEHVEGIIDNIHRNHPGTTPTFIMGYGEDMQFKLLQHYKGLAKFIFNEQQANEIALPVAEDLLRHINRQPFNN